MILQDFAIKLAVWRENAMSYVSEQLELLKKKNPGEPEFIQAATEVLTSLVYISPL